jgi:hypothetical protein
MTNKRDALAEEYSKSVIENMRGEGVIDKHTVNCYKAGYDARDEEVKRLRDCLMEAQKALVGGADLGGVFWRDIAIARIAGVIEHESGGAG